MINQKINLNSIENIIFDWGGVITELCYECCRKAFLELGVINFSENYIDLLRIPIFTEFETGKINEIQFRNFIRLNSKNNLRDEEIDNAWCKMLGDTPNQRIEIIKKLKNKHFTILMSNTNSIHVNYYNNYLFKNFGINNFNEIFNKVYYSHEIGKRKPDIDFFKYIIEKNNLNPHKTIFLDDNIENIKSASSLGIKTILVTKENPLEKIFQKVLL